MEVDPARCHASGPGFNGGGVGQELKFMLTLCNSEGIRVKQGGADVMVLLTAPRTGDIVSTAQVKDNGDGTFQITYTAPEARGFYDLNIEVNGEPACNSPLPIFFTDSNTENNDVTVMEAQDPENPTRPANVLTVTGEDGTSVNINPELLQSQVQTALAAARAAVVSSSLAATLPPNAPAALVHLAPALQAALLDASPIVAVRNVNFLLDENSLTQLFSFAGTIKSMRLEEKLDGREAYIEFEDGPSANKAMVLNGQQVAGKALKIEKQVDPNTIAASSSALLQSGIVAAANAVTQAVAQNAPTPVDTSKPQTVDPNAWRQQYEEKKTEIVDSMKMYAALLASSKYGVSVDRLYSKEERDRKGRDRSRDRKGDRKERSRSRDRKDKREDRDRKDTEKENRGRDSAREKEKGKEEAPAPAPAPAPVADEKEKFAEWDLL